MKKMVPVMVLGAAMIGFVAGQGMLLKPEAVLSGHFDELSMTPSAVAQEKGFEAQSAAAQVIDGIRSIAYKYPGLESFMIHWAEGLAPKEFKEQLTWFAKDVMPALKRG